MTEKTRTLKSNLKTVAIDLIDKNDLSVNQQDNATFERLKVEIETRGLLDPPVVMENGDRYTCISGWHRISAAKAVGYVAIDVIVKTKKELKVESDEDEFNVVTNANLVRGQTTQSNIVKKIKQRKLDPTKLDVFKTPMEKLFPMYDPSAEERGSGSVGDQAKIADLAVKISKEVAKSFVLDPEEVVVCLATGTKLGAVFKLPLEIPSGESKRLAAQLKPRLRQVLMEEAGTIEDEGPAGGEDWVPLYRIFETASVPGTTSEVLTEAIAKMIKDKRLTEKDAWKALDLLAAAWLQER